MIAFAFRFYESLLISCENKGLYTIVGTNDISNAFCRYTFRPEKFLLSHFIFYVVLLPFQIEFMTYIHTYSYELVCLLCTRVVYKWRQTKTWKFKVLTCTMFHTTSDNPTFLCSLKLRKKNFLDPPSLSVPNFKRENISFV